MIFEKVILLVGSTVKSKLSLVVVNYQYFCYKIKEGIRNNTETFFTSFYVN